jgi:perosamine synthetase
MIPEQIPVAGPWITKKEIEYVTDAVTNAWYGKANMYHERFEKAFAEYIGVEYAIALPSCTSALHLSLLALGVGADDEVIVPDVTWIASSAPISYVGATTVFADVEPKTWCLCPKSFEKNITSKTKAVIPVDLYGSMPNLTEIQDIAKKHGIAVIEDAAEAIGSEYFGGKAGSFGDTGVFSFHGSKTITTSEGGMLVTNQEKIYQRCLFLRDHGRQPGDTTFRNLEVAYKYKMSSMQAALGLAQLERIEEIIDRKREIFSWYQSALKDIDGISLNYEGPGVKSSYWMVTIILDKKLNLKKYSLIESLKEKGINCRPFFQPLSSLGAYENSKQSEDAILNNKASYELSPYGVNLPSGMNVTPEIVNYIADSLKQCLKK